jgi:hypothetical protein
VRLYVTLTSWQTEGSKGSVWRRLEMMAKGPRIYYEGTRYSMAGMVESCCETIFMYNESGDIFDYKILCIKFRKTTVVSF